jgi:hypothetical protein
MRISWDGKLSTNYTQRCSSRSTVDYTKFLLAMQENSCNSRESLLYVLTHFAIMLWGVAVGFVELGIGVSAYDRK